MQTFNLEKALAGAALVTRDGRKVTNFRKEGNDMTYPFYANVGENLNSYTPNGTYTVSCDGSADLFLADVQLDDATPVPQPQNHYGITECFVPGDACTFPNCECSRIAFNAPQGSLTDDRTSQPQNILEEANSLIYGERESDYGSVTDNFNNIAQGWSVILRTKVTAEQVGLAMAWLKIARHCNKPKRDNLVDGAGYLGCVDKIEKGL